MDLRTQVDHSHVEQDKIDCVLGRDALVVGEDWDG
jgi:hypothetical protein